MLTIEEFRALSDSRLMIVFEREMPHPEHDQRLVFVIQKTRSDIQNLLLLLLLRGFSENEVAQISQILRPIMLALIEESATDEGLVDIQPVFAGENRLSVF